MSDMTKDRAKDVQTALSMDQCITWLHRRWGVSYAATIQWLDRHADSDDRKRLAENGRTRAQQALRKFDLGARLQLIAACRAVGMSYERIGDAVGCSGVSIWTTVHKHAPDGLEQAVADYRDDDEPQSAAA